MLDGAVFHILTSMNRAALLEGTPYGSHSGGCTAGAANCTPFVPARPDLQTLIAPDFAIAKNVAEESATLLKNTDHALPLAGTDFAGNGVLVMGPTATATYVGGGGQRARDAVRADHELADGAPERRQAPARSATSRATTSTASSCPRRR